MFFLPLSSTASQEKLLEQVSVFTTVPSLSLMHLVTLLGKDQSQRSFTLTKEANTTASNSDSFCLLMEFFPLKVTKLTLGRTAIKSHSSDDSNKSLVIYNRFETLDQLIEAILLQIHYYNSRRIQSALKMTPRQKYEQALAKLQDAQNKEKTPSWGV